MKRNGFLAGPLKIAVLMASVIVVTSCSEDIEVLTPLKSVLTANDGSWVSIEGRWETLAQPGSTIIPNNNAVKVFCSQQLMVCDEWIARLFGPKEALAAIEEHYMNLQNTKFRVVEWTEDKIRALDEGGAVDLELNVSLADSSAQRRSVETKARGNDTADPDISRLWILK